MTATRRTQAHANATADLTWCRTIPHTTAHALTVLSRLDTMRYRHGTSNDAIVADLRDRANSVSSGHADPTASSIDRRQDTDQLPDETSPQITHTVELIATKAHELACYCAVVCERAQPRAFDPFGGVQPLISDALASLYHLRPHLEPAIDAGADEGHINHLLIAVVAESAGWLRTKTAAILGAAPAAEREPVRQKQVVGCISHARFEEMSGRRRFERVDPKYRDCCTDCGRFRQQHRCLPTKAIIDGWDNRRSPSEGMIAEAKAESRRKTKPTTKAG